MEKVTFQSQFWPKPQAEISVWVAETNGQIKEFQFPYPLGHNFWKAAESVLTELHESRPVEEALECVGFNEKSAVLVLRRKAA